ncbi:hypothetical protein Tco_0876403 [Tanacetum coccineum]|uniref:Uncharacterized protein n=1 Tax=Tanacetum coccineum TaxID=301880 RepID=A0ABQ5BV57_9ASTR
MLNRQKNQRHNTGNTDDQLNVEATPKRVWFKKPKRPPTPNSDWNVRKLVDFRPPQTWISKIAQAEKPPISFDKLMNTPIDFLTYAMNHLNIDNLTKDHLVGPVFNILEGTCRSRVELEYNIKECRKVVHVDYFINNDLEYLRGGSSSKKYTTSTTKTKAVKYDIQGIEDTVPSLWSPVKVSYDRYVVWEFLTGVLNDNDSMDLQVTWRLKFKEKISNYRNSRKVTFQDFTCTILKICCFSWFKRNSPNLSRKLPEEAQYHQTYCGVALRIFTRRIFILKRVEDLQLGVKSYQKKLNITKPETFRSDISNRIPYTAYNNPQGIIYEDKYKRNRLMRMDELYKFNDRTLTSVRSVLHDIASNLRMDYLPKRR